MKFFSTALALTLVTSFCLSLSAERLIDEKVKVTSNYDWSNYAQDKGSSKYAPLDQINRSTVKDLQIVWSWDSTDNQRVTLRPQQVPLSFKATPIKINNTLFTSTSLGAVVALDAQTGALQWEFDTETWKDGRPVNLGFHHRGVSYWENSGKKRILMPTNNGYLWSLDAETGLPDSLFGDGGKVDLTEGYGREINRKHYGVTAAPTVVGDIVVIGGLVADYPLMDLPPGHVRGFDIHTGKQRWIFHSIPQHGESGNDTWEDDSWKRAGAANVWTLMSADPELGYVYLPFGTPNNDWYGGARPGDNLYAESLVCLDAKTGKRVWHFQMVHHGLWDYDLPAAPNLVDIKVDGKAIKAVAQVSKQGFVYVLDRVTGAPVWPIEERAVQRSNVPGEHSSPTQPIPSKPEAFELQGISDATLIDFTPELRAAAEKIISRFDHGVLFTPPSLKGTIQLPGWGGGANWSGAGFDPETSMFYIPSMTMPSVVQLVEPTKDGTTENRYIRGGTRNVRGPQRLPLTKPPYGRISAINLDTGEYVWVKPNGEGIRQKIIDMGIDDPGPVGTFTISGPLVTKMLLFQAVTDNKKHLLTAYDKQTGETVHQFELPAAPGGTPMTYMVDGKQYIVIAVGGVKDARLVTLALP